MDIAQDGNLFPREDILEAVAQSDWRDQPVHALAWVLGALGLIVTALGAPVLEPLAMEPTLHAAGERSLWLEPLSALARTIGWAGAGIETAWYWLSALGLGLTFPMLGAALRALGVGARLAFVAALVAVLCPLMWTHGRLPSHFAWGALGSSFCLLLVCAPSDTGKAGERGYGVRLALGLLVATVLHSGSLALVIPLVAAAQTRGRWQAVIPLAIAGLLAVILHLAAPGTLEASAALYGRSLDTLLGLGALAVTLPLAFSKSEEESPPPAWLFAWLLVGLGFDGTALIPGMAAIAAGALGRFARPDNALKLAGGLLGVQLIALATVAFTLPSSEASGLASARPDLFEPSDAVIVPSSSWLNEGDESDPAVYLVRRRFGIPVFAADDPKAQDWTGRRIQLGTDAAGPALNPASGTIEAEETARQ